MQQARQQRKQSLSLAQSPRVRGSFEHAELAEKDENTAMARILRKMNSCHASTLRVMLVVPRRAADLPEWRFLSIPAKEDLLLSAFSARSNDRREWARGKQLSLMIPFTKKS
jgi:hypothetical protein